MHVIIDSGCILIHVVLIKLYNQGIVLDSGHATKLHGFLWYIYACFIYVTFYAKSTYIIMYL